MRILLVDNYDSYTYNLWQLLAEVNGQEPVVITNDASSWSVNQLDAFDNVVISRGPGRPKRSSDLGHSLTIVRQTTLPVLGVCLGHQAIAHAAGASVDPAPEPRHGHLSRIQHDGSALFRGIPQGFQAVRYHSLCVNGRMPSDLEATAWAEDGVLMALRHRRLPQWGVQFHPESIASEHGLRLLGNFRDLTPPRTRETVDLVSSTSRAPASQRARTLGSTWRTLPTTVDTEAAYRALYGESTYAFWLDSSRVESGLSRYSYLGDAAGPLGEVLTYRVTDPFVRIAHSNATHTEEPGDVFEVLQRRLDAIRFESEELPFDFTAGYVGYFGYELKAITSPTKNRHSADTPDAVWLFSDRFVVVDHATGSTHAVAIHEVGDAARKNAADWVDTTLTTLATLLPTPDSAVETTATPQGETAAARELSRSPHQYLSDIEACQRQLVAGESYEVCLTNSLRVPFRGRDLDFYRRLRSLNPAPFAALLRANEVTVFSSSPERFLRVQKNGTVESKPIKGTAPRSTDPAQDEALRNALTTDPKTRAENLMIVDLIRNDLGRVCMTGSVHVPALMETETYATVHQLVSTITGTLRPHISPVECTRACFPGGSMTGAPKVRTMEVIDSLETTARGIYSGALGYFSINGTADLSITIRTAIRHGDELSIGAGGAVVLDSDPVDELNEMLLKMNSSLRAYQEPQAERREAT